MIELASAKDLFKARQFDQEVIVLCARWYLNLQARSLQIPRRKFPRRASTQGIHILCSAVSLLSTASGREISSTIVSSVGAKPGKRPRNI
jgi:hypothetical protein